jgi:hypothetical protein
MKLVCPSCGLTASAEAWINDASARDLLLAVATLPAPLPKATLPYLGLFRPEKRALSWDKAGKIVAELTKLTAPGHVQVQGKVSRPCPPRIFAAAMEKMVEQRDSIRRPLPNHNYLKQVAWQLADEEDARGEAGKRQKEAAGSCRSRTHHPNPLPQGEGASSLLPGREGLGMRAMSPLAAYIQGHRDDKPTEKEMQAWHKERLL